MMAGITERAYTLEFMPLCKYLVSCGLPCSYGKHNHDNLIKANKSRFVLVVVAAKSGVSLHNRLLAAVIR